MKDITDIYIHMIESFECDLVLARDGKKSLSQLDLKDYALAEDIELLERLSFGLRHGTIKIIEKQFNI